MMFGAHRLSFDIVAPCCTRRGTCYCFFVAGCIFLRRGTGVLKNNCAGTPMGVLAKKRGGREVAGLGNFETHRLKHTLGYLILRKILISMLYIYT